MTTLEVLLHIPMKQLDNLLRAELGHRDVKSVKVDRSRGIMTIEHDRRLPQTGLWL